mgnify:CR=1 FL=1
MRMEKEGKGYRRKVRKRQKRNGSKTGDEESEKEYMRCLFLKQKGVNRRKEEIQ